MVKEEDRKCVSGCAHSGIVSKVFVVVMFVATKVRHRWEKVRLAARRKFLSLSLFKSKLIRESFSHRDASRLSETPSIGVRVVEIVDVVDRDTETSAKTATGEVGRPVDSVHLGPVTEVEARHGIEGTTGVEGPLLDEISEREREHDVSQSLLMFIVVALRGTPDGIPQRVREKGSLPRIEVEIVVAHRRRRSLREPVPKARHRRQRGEGGERGRLARQLRYCSFEQAVTQPKIQTPQSVDDGVDTVEERNGGLAAVV